MLPDNSRSMTAAMLARLADLEDLLKPVVDPTIRASAATQLDRMARSILAKPVKEP
jgi:hypothetical protein